MVNNSTNINKTKESLYSNGQQFYQYQQNKQSPFNSNHCTQKRPNIWHSQSLLFTY